MLRLICKAKEQPRERVCALAEELGISPRTAELLLNRGINNAEEATAFLHPSQGSLEEAYLLKDMDKAVERIRKAVANGEKIVIFGDYDADGVCATAIMLNCLNKLGARVDYMIPSRHEDGYGMTVKSVEQLHAAGTDLIITVDNGVKSVEEAKRCYELGMELIVTDHHIPGDELPRCEALILCNNADDYPNRHICGAGIAYKLAEAILGKSAALEYIPFAGIATVADIVPLTGENRAFVALAVKAVRAGKCAEGIKALCSVAQGKLQTLSAGDFAYRIAPRLNAASRIEDAGIAVKLLMERNADNAMRIAARLEELNSERKAQETGIFNAACAQLEGQDLTNRRCIVLHGENWNSGVIGIAAARIAEKFYRPTILLSGSGTLTGSCRSIRDVNIHSALASCEELFSRFGGHAYAAGLTMLEKDVDALRERLDKYLWENESEERFIPSVEYDFETELGSVTRSLAEELNLLEPFGSGNPQPVVLTRGVRFANLERIGNEGRHVRCHMVQNEQYIPSVYFNAGSDLKTMLEMDRCDAVYTPNINCFMNRTSLQLGIKDIRCAESENVEEWVYRHSDKFIDAICRNVLYNSSRVPEGLVFSDNIEALVTELVEKSALGTAVMCFTVAGAIRLCTLLSRRGLWNRIDVRFGGNAGGLCAYNAAILAPEMAKTELSRYKNIIVFDTVPSGGMLSSLRIDNDKARMYVARPNGNEIADLIADIPQTREDFITLYRALRQTAGVFYNLAVMADTLCAVTHAPRSHCELAANVFYELGFVVKAQGGIRVEQFPPRRALEESRTYFVLNSLKELNDMYLQQCKEGNHEA